MSRRRPHLLQDQVQDHRRLRRDLVQDLLDHLDLLDLLDHLDHLDLPDLNH